MKKIIIFGTTGMSKVITEYIGLAGKDKVVAYTVDQSYMNYRSSFNDLPLVPFEKINELYSTKEFYILNVLSTGSGTKHIGEQKFDQVKEKGYRFYTFIDPNAFISPSAKIGENCIICHSTIVEPMVILEDGVFVRPSVYLSHETTIGAFTYIAPRAALSGNIKVGRHCFIGTNATIRDNIKIGNDSIIGAGSVVLKNLPAESVYKAALGNILPIDRFKIIP